MQKYNLAHLKRPATLEKAVRHVVHHRLPQLPPQVLGLSAHGLDGGVQLLRGLLAGVGHVLVEEVLQGLAHSVALGDDALPPLIPD